jgi:multidrug efflux system membrane fusion protein
MQKRWSLLPVVLLVPLGGCQGSNAAQSRQPPPPNVEYQLPVSGRVIDYADFPGSTEAIISVQVLARVSGYMTKVYFKDGTLVREGDKLFQIDPQQYKAELDRAEANVKQIEAHKWRLEREYLRAKNLLAMAKISQEEHDRYEGDYNETAANLKLAIANRDLAKLNYEWTEVRAPCAGLLSRRLVDPGNLIRADSTALTSIVSQDPMYVYFDVDEQNMLHHVRRLIQEGKIKASSEKAVPVLVGLSDEAPDYPHAGVVDFTDNRVDVNTGALRFRANVRNDKGILTPGLFVRVRLPVSEPHGTLFVREEALTSDQGRKILFVLVENTEPAAATTKPGALPGALPGAKPAERPKPSGPPAKYRVETRNVKIGSLRGKFRAIEGGLKPDEKIVVSGLQRIKTGSLVNATLKPTTESPPEEVAFENPPADLQQVAPAGRAVAHDTHDVRR